MDERSIGSIRDEELTDVAGGAEDYSVSADFDAIPDSELFAAPLYTVTPVSAKSEAEIALEAVRASVKVGHSSEDPSTKDHSTQITGYSQGGGMAISPVPELIGED